MTRLRSLLIPLLGLTLAAPAQAGYQFVFSTSSSPSASLTSNFSVLETQTVDAYVFLQATGDDIATLRNTGLESYGVKLSYDASATAKVVSDSNIVGNTAFNAGDLAFVGSPTNNFAQINGSVNVSPTTTVKAGASDDRIYLAKFTFTGLSAGDTFTVSADPDPTVGVDDTVLAGGSSIDALIANSSATITVTAIPEPGGLILCGLVASGVAGGAYRRWRGRRPVAAVS